jgi:hypothetical protein
MKAKKTSVAAAVLLLAVGVGRASAQAAEEPRSRQGPPREARVEMIMAMRDRLALTDEQFAALEEIRAETVAERSARAAEVAEMASRLRAGQIPRSAMMAFLESRREDGPELAQARQERIDSILDDTQLEAIRELRTRARAFARGRASARGDRMRGPRTGRRPRGFGGSGMRGFDGSDMRGRAGPAARAPGVDVPTGIEFR